MQQTCNCLQSLAVCFAESIKLGAVYVEDSYYLIPLEQGDDYFRARKAAAGNVAGKLLYVRDNNSSPFCPGSAANTPAYLYP